MTPGSGGCAVPARWSVREHGLVRDVGGVGVEQPVVRQPGHGDGRRRVTGRPEHSFTNSCGFGRVVGSGRGGLERHLHARWRDDVGEPDPGDRREHRVYRVGRSDGHCSRWDHARPAASSRGQSLTVQGTNAVNTTVNLGGDVANAGSITMTSTGGGWSYLEQNGHTLTNSGSFSVLPGSGGARYLRNGPFVNTGSFSTSVALESNGLVVHQPGHGDGDGRRLVAQHARSRTRRVRSRRRVRVRWSRPARTRRATGRRRGTRSW